MTSYYSRTLAGTRLRACYDLAPPRVARYLEAEVRHLVAAVDRSMRVLELGCGYGRVLSRLTAHAGAVVGIDVSPESLRLAAGVAPGCRLARMDALRLGFRDGVFDLVACIQNGIAVFGGEPLAVLREAVRVTRRGGRLLFSSYAPGFWEHRLRWFELQAAHGLVGPIDPLATTPGTIVCRDGFRAGTATATEFRAWASALGISAAIAEVDGSSVWCEMERREAGRPR